MWIWESSQAGMKGRRLSSPHVSVSPGGCPQCLAALQILSYTSGKASWQPICLRSL